jgi:hypothetical protein
MRRCSRHVSVALHAAICCVLLCPSVSLGAGGVGITPRSDAYKTGSHHPHPHPYSAAVAALRLRGGLRDDAHELKAPRISGETGQHETTGDPDGSAVTCLPAKGNRQEDSAASSEALKRLPTPMCLEMAAYDAFENNQVEHRGGYPRYAWDPKRRIWLLFKRADEDLSIETLRGKWDFPPEDCLTFRPRKPDKWQYVDWAPGLVGWVEFCFWITPLFNQLLHLWRGLFPCAVCGLARSKHPCPSEREADAAFWQVGDLNESEDAWRCMSADC